MMLENDSSGNIFRILIATDIHLGYDEKDTIKGNDSLVTFEEVLENAKNLNVDFVLLGGDLFHDNKPSRKVFHGCISLLRKYCMGGKPVQFEFLSDESVNFEHCQFPSLNYEDPNYNISIPVFSIHGNHDDPTGSGNLCSLDILHSTGFINYFGKTTSLEKLQLSPLLMQKGLTKLALYGLGSLRDERLHRLFLNKNVLMLRPRESQDDWFNILVLHQNRAKHSSTNYIPEQFLDDFLDLVFWGHEHECRIEPEWNGAQNIYVSQPGSTIATSLSEGETKAKHIGLLEVRGREFKLRKIPLQTVRKFYLEDIVLSDTTLNPSDPNAGKKVEAYCQERVESLLDTAASEHTGSRKQPKEPIIRLRIDYMGFETFSINRFGRRFVHRVANPDQMILFHQRRKTSAKGDAEADLDFLASLRPQTLDAFRVEDMVKDYFSKANLASQLKLLTGKGMSEAVKEYVDKEEREAISQLVKYQLQKTQKYLMVRNIKEENIDDEIMRFKVERSLNKEESQDVSEALRCVQNISQSLPGNKDYDMPDIDSDHGDIDAMSIIESVQGRGRGCNRGSRRRSVLSSSISLQKVGKDQDSKSRARGRPSRCQKQGKATVVVDSRSRTVKDFFVGGSQQLPIQQQVVRTSVYEDDTDDTVLTSDDNDPFSIPCSKRKKIGICSTRPKRQKKSNFSDTD